MNRLLPRYDSSGIDPNYKGSLLGVNFTTGAVYAISALSLTNAKPLTVALVDGTGTQLTSFGGTSSSFGSAFPATGTAAGFTDGTNMRGARVFDIDTGAGTEYVTGANLRISASGGSIEAKGQQTMANSLPVTLASDQTAINIKANDAVDANNSTTATLLANATFTGTATDILDYTSVAVYVYSDQSSATNGLKIEFSSDGTNWNDASIVSFVAGSSAPNDGETYAVDARARYLRVVYTNGSVNQTAFRLSTLLKVGTLTGDVIDVAFVPNSVSAQAQLSKAAIMGKTTAGGGAWVDVKVNPSGALTTASTTQDSGGNSITSNSTTTTATFGLDMNIRSILNTAPTTPGFLDIKGADGNVFVRQTTASNLNATVVGTGTFAVQATEATLDAAIVSQGTALGTIKNLMTAGSVTTNAPTYTTGQINPLSLTTAGGLRVDLKDTASNTNNLNMNVAQINGVTPLMGAGNTGTGSPRVTIATDQAAIATWGLGATGAAVPSGAQYEGFNAATALPTAATAGNLTGAMSDKYGRQVVIPHAMRDLVLPMTQLTLTATTTETTLIGQVASTFLDITSIIVINTSATATQVDFRDSTAGTVRLSLYVPAGDTRGVVFNTPLPQNAVNNNWTAKCGTSVSSVIITGTYITNK